ncbi:MAG: hypothetical protein ACI8W7_000455 [Gammaproteobacteria bacterium]|jgi:hypothetical protein
MNRYMILEHGRLQADIASLDQRLAGTRRVTGLKARSVVSFLSQLRRHKSEMLKELDRRLAVQVTTH